MGSISTLNLRSSTANIFKIANKGLYFSAYIFYIFQLSFHEPYLYLHSQITCKLHTERSWTDDGDEGPSLLWGNSANHWTMLPVLCCNVKMLFTLYYISKQTNTTPKKGLKRCHCVLNCLPVYQRSVCRVVIMIMTIPGILGVYCPFKSCLKPEQACTQVCLRHCEQEYWS